MKKLCALLGVVWFTCVPLCVATAETAVTTYHYDALRSGWDQTETTLTAGNAGSVQLQQTVSLDGQVDAQPLLVPAVDLGAGGTHDVLYVVTENNTVYGLDAASGAVLLQRRLGPPVPQSALPGGCDNNDVTVGITATPVIDPASDTLYVVAYIYKDKTQAYALHALSLATLGDSVKPRIVVATRKLSDGSTYDFQAAVMRQRPALLLSGGNVYAGFGSFCDGAADVVRGWVLGWNAGTLAPLPVQALPNRQAAAPDGTFLTSVWMSGYGLAADAAGSVYFATGNSDESGKSWNAHRNLSESVVKLSPDLSTVQGYFTPVGKKYGQVADDINDGDLGAGGVLLLPDQPGALPHLAVAAGKLSPEFLLNRDDLGGRGGELQNALSFGCWCGPSSFMGADGQTRVVTSTWQAIIIFRIKTSPKPALDKQIVTQNLSTGQDAGFFTSISSNGTKKNSAVIWALTRPTDGDPANVLLYAFDGKTGEQLTSQVAGTWPNSNADADLVPVVANGRIYVASYKQLAIFGFGAPARAVAIAHPQLDPPMAIPGAPHILTGLVTSVRDTQLTLRLRDDRDVPVDTAPAHHAFGAAKAVVGQAARVRGDWAGGVFEAVVVMHAKRSSALWAKDQ